MQAELYTVSLPFHLSLSFMPRPRGGEWLADEMVSLHAQGVRMVVSLLTESEIWQLGLMREAEWCMTAGMRFMTFPITDRSIPPFTEATFAFIDTLAEETRSGTHVAIHCRLGIGRSALIAASILVAMGIDVPLAFQTLSRARGVTIPDTPEQYTWVERFAAQQTT